MPPFPKDKSPQAKKTPGATSLRQPHEGHDAGDAPGADDRQRVGAHLLGGEGAALDGLLFGLTDPASFRVAGDDRDGHAQAGQLDPAGLAAGAIRRKRLHSALAAVRGTYEAEYYPLYYHIVRRYYEKK